MSMPIKQAVNQVRLTNVAIVRYKRTGKRFEIACYKNKVVNWRNGVEKDIDEVLQIDRVFLNVSKGIVANSKQLIKAFDTDNQEEVCRIILAKGELQVSDKEREMQYETTYRDIATIVTDKCINPQTGRPYPSSTIETAMKETIHYAVVPSKSAKQQALDVIRLLKQHIPLERAKMLLKIVVNKCTEESESQLLEKLHSFYAQIRTNSLLTPGQNFVEVLLDPGCYRAMDEFVHRIPGGSLEVKDFSVQEQRETDVEQHGQSDVQVIVLPPREEGKKPTPVPTKKSTAPAEVTVEKEEVYDAYDQANQTNKKMNRKKKKKKNKKLAQIHKDMEAEELAKTQEKQQAEQESIGALRLAQQLAAAKLRGDDDTEGEKKTIAAAKPELKGLKCSTCLCGFGNDRRLQSEHYRSDIHRMNLKLKSSALPPVTQEEFDFMGPDEIEAILLDYKVRD